MSLMCSWDVQVWSLLTNGQTGEVQNAMPAAPRAVCPTKSMVSRFSYHFWTACWGETQAPGLLACQHPHNTPCQGTHRPLGWSRVATWFRLGWISGTGEACLQAAHHAGEWLFPLGNYLKKGALPSSGGKYLAGLRCLTAGEASHTWIPRREIAAFFWPRFRKPASPWIGHGL